MLIKEPLLREKRIKWPLTRSVMRCTHLLSGRLPSVAASVGQSGTSCCQHKTPTMECQCQYIALSRPYKIDLSVAYPEPPV